MFSILACKVKQNAPTCHTYLEIIYTRYGVLTHWVFIFFALLTNVLVSSQLLLGGSAVVTSLTGMNVYAAIFLIPLGVCVYVVLGGLRATFLCKDLSKAFERAAADLSFPRGDYSHTLILMVIILYFMFSAYTTNAQIGSPSAMYQLLKDAAVKRPVTGNQDGSYVTMKSNFALIFGVIQLCSGSGTVFLDQAYWQRAIASRPTTAVRAYILGGLAWYAIPFGFATTLGLAAVALTDSPSFPAMTQAQVSAGLSSAFAATALLGTGGSVALLIVLFMAVTSCASAELIAVSSILTFDVFKTYVKPSATPEQLITVAHIMIGVWGLVMALFACIWNLIGIDLGWLFLVMGLLIGGAVFPTAFAITWKGQTKAGALSGAVTGLCAGLIAWLVTAHQYYGSLSVSTTGMEYPTLAGNLAALMTGLIVTVAVSLAKPEPFDWDITRSINAASSSTFPTATSNSGSIDMEEKNDEASPNRNPNSNPNTSPTPHSDEEQQPVTPDAFVAPDPQSLRQAFKLACLASFLLTFAMDFLIPIPMFLSHYVFSEGFFVAWVVVTFAWVFCSTAISVLLPLWETAGFLGDLFGGRL